jgi:hypothetical protein
MNVDLSRGRRRGVRRRRQGAATTRHRAAALHALQSGEIDILSRNTTWTITRDTSLGLNFVGVNYYDGQGFMVPKKLKVKSAKQLNGATVCVQPGTTTELNLADYFRTHKMNFKPVVIEKLEEVLNAYFAGRCDVYTTDHSGLVAVRASRAPKPDDHVILPEIISKEPLGPAVRHGDDRWFDIVKWTLFAMIEAEELGLTSKNIDKEAASPDPRSSASSAPPATSARCSASTTSGRAHRQAGRQLRRVLRRQPQAARLRARHQQALDAGRPDVRAADSL